MKSMYTAEEVADMIRRGDKLFLSAEISILEKLPRGNWIGGSIPYFMSEEGGLFSQDKIQVVKIPDYVMDFKINAYDEDQLTQIPKDYFDNGFSYIIIPAFSRVHVRFGEESRELSDLFSIPLVGWVAGFNLDSPGKGHGYAINGKTGLYFNEKAVVMHLKLPPQKKVSINTINLFQQGNGDVLSFEESGFNVRYVYVNGVKEIFSDYIKNKELDLTLPLVTDFQGKKINVSFKGVNEFGFVELYAPVFPETEYQLASPIGDYEDEFNEKLEELKIDPLFSCNCILNFLYAKLEGRKTGHIVGPMTFGEIAYILLNQTMVYLMISDETNEK